MTKEQESQQAQTIARIKDEYSKHFGRTYHAFTDFAPLVTELHANLGSLLEIVDSQAQKITQQDSEIRAQKSALEVAAELLPKSRKERDEQAQKIADQAKIIATNAAYAIELQGKLSEQEKQLGLMTLGIRSRDVKIAEQANDIEKLKASLSI